MVILWNFLLILIPYLGTLYTTDAATMRCYHGSFNTFSVYSLDKPEILVNSSCYNPKRKTVIYAFGFNGEPTDDSVKAIVKAYLSLPFNVILLNWQEEASGILGSNVLGYVTAVRKSLSIGSLLGQALVKLYKVGLEPCKIHLVGFSLGAPLMGNAAREVQKTGHSIATVIGLDPPRPLFDALSLPCLDADCAAFVAIIHTNQGSLGTAESSGTVDIWLNCRDSVQPGCEDESGKGIGLTSSENSCSHNRAWIYFVEMLNKRNSYVARSATSCEAWTDKGETIIIGAKSHAKVRGNFYLNTNSKPFYGKGKAGSVPDS